MIVEGRNMSSAMPAISSASRHASSSSWSSPSSARRSASSCAAISRARSCSTFSSARGPASPGNEAGLRSPSVGALDVRDDILGSPLPDPVDGSRDERRHRRGKNHGPADRQRAHVERDPARRHGRTDHHMVRATAHELPAIAPGGKLRPKRLPMRTRSSPSRVRPVRCSPRNSASAYRGRSAHTPRSPPIAPRGASGSSAGTPDIPPHNRPFAASKASRRPIGKCSIVSLAPRGCRQ